MVVYIWGGFVATSVLLNSEELKNPLKGFSSLP
jgi:hypothetical protein